jgi:hypothetical protein
LKRSIFATASAFALVFAGMALASPARAAYSPEVCDDANYCLNAWNGGPLVKAYKSGVQNDIFVIVYEGNFLYSIIDQDGGPFDENYIGDNNNNPGDAKAGLVGAGSWGTAFQENAGICPSGEFALYNNHWKAYLNFSDSDGSQVYLNSSAGCFAYVH